MDQRGDEIHASETEASGGSKEGVVRWVLIIGTLLAIITLSAIWMTGAATQPEGDSSEYNVSNQAAAGENAATEDDGEPLPPAFGEDSGGTEANPQPDSNQAPDSVPSPAQTPGDAPAGDPRPTNQ
jgi:hypothetical protein